MSKKVVVVEMEVVFEGDYCTASELPDVVAEWISAGFEDRDDFKGFQIDSYVLEEKK